MKFGSTWYQKPPIGTPLDRDHPLLKGLVSFVPMWEMGGSRTADLISGLSLSTGGSPIWTPGPSPNFGSGLVFNGSGYGVRATAPQSLYIQPPMTMVIRFRALGTSSNASTLMALTTTNSYSGNYIQWSGATTVGIVSFAGGTYTPTIFTPVVGVDYTLVVVLNLAGYTAYLIKANGVYTTSTGSWGPLTSLSYTSNAQLALGQNSSFNPTGNPNSNVYLGAVYNRALSLAEALSWGRNPWQLFKSPANIVGLTSVLSFSASPTTIYANDPIGTTLTLTGTGTSWSGTPFSISGVAGATITSQTVNSTRSATITLTTTSGTGAITIFDGARNATNTVTVAPDSFTISPTTIPANHPGNVTLTLSGLGTSWSSNIFTLSGVTGVTKVSQTINSATSATVVVSTGSGTGTLSISDGAISNTATVANTTFALSPATGLYSVAPVTITATGSTGSLWTHETASTLFSVSGTNGSSISSITVLSDTSATFTFAPGTATGNIVFTQTPNGATANFAILGPTSLHVSSTSPSSTGWLASTASNNLLSNQTDCSYTLFLKVNNYPYNFNDFVYNAVCALAASVDHTKPSFNAFIFNASSQQITMPSYTFTPGVVYHIAMTWKSATNTLVYYVNGQIAGTSTSTVGTRNTNAPMNVGFPGNVADFAVQDIAVWNGYALTSTEVKNLCHGSVTPKGTNTAATSWWTFYGPQGGTPAIGDIGLNDAIGSNNFASSTGTASGQVTYDSPLVYTAPTQAVPYITKSGQWAVFGFQRTYTSTTAITGTVSVASGGNSLTTSVGQTAWVGSQIRITGDSSNTTYTIYAGSGQNYKITPVYGGSANALNTGAILVTNPLTNCSSIASYPTIQVKFGGIGSYSTVQIGNAFFQRTNSEYPFAMFPLQCGYIKSLVVQKGGSGYVSPTVSASGGGGSGLTFGTPILTGGIVSVVSIGGGGGSGYPYPTTGLPPTITIPTQSVTLNGTLTAGSTSVTGLSSTAGFVPGMMVTGATGIGTTIASVVSSTAITLSVPAIYSGSTPLTVYGKQALAIATVGAGGNVTSVSVFCAGSLFTSSTVTGTIAAAPNQSGSGGTVVFNVGQIIAYVPVTNGGSGYTSPPTISVTDGSGSGAVVAPVMGGLTSSDVVRYTAADSWAQCMAGGANAATNAAIPNYVGQSEPGFGNVLGLNLPTNQRVLPIGVNITETYQYQANIQGTTNFLNRTYSDTTINTRVSSVDPGGRPLFITGTAANPTSMTYIDSQADNYGYQGFPTPMGTGVNGRLWTFIADELNPADPIVVALNSSNTVTLASSSAGTSTRGVNAITLAAGGSGYTSVPTVSFVGGGATTSATAYATINANGQVVWITLTSPGVGYTSTPTIALSGGGGSGASATATTGSVIVGKTWQFQTIQSQFNFSGHDRLYFHATSKSSGTPAPYPYTLCNEVFFSPQASANAYANGGTLPSRSTALQLEPSYQTYLTSATPKYAASIRAMNCTIAGTYGNSNVVDACDLPQPGAYSWYGGALATASTSPVQPPLTQNPTASRAIPISTIRTYSVSPTCVSQIAVTSIGSGYSGTVPISFTGGGSGAAATALVTGGVIQSVKVTSGGSGYSGTVTASAPYTGGSTAAFSVTLSGGAVTAVSVTSGGTSYYSTAPVAISDGAGIGATAVATVTPGGSIVGGTLQRIDVVTGGSGYTSPPTISFINTGGGTNAAATANVVNGSVVSVTITAVGNGFTAIPGVAFSGGGGTGATALANIGGVEVTTGGSGYVSPTAAIVTPAGASAGTGAVLAVTVGFPSGGIGGMTITNAGAGYGSTPIVTISGTGGGSGAIVVPTMSGGAVAGFTILAAGSGYSGTVTATLSGGSPSVAATATPVVWNTTWSSPNVYLPNPGTGTSTAVVPDSHWLGYGNSPSSGGPYLIPAPTPGYTNQYQAPVGGIFVAECVTASPHCLKTGQTLQIRGTATIYASVGKTASSAVTAASNLNGAQCLVWVTGPNTFATVFQGPITDAGYGMPGHFNNVAGSFAVDYVATIYVPDQGAMPYPVIASMVGDLPGTNLWINLPPGVTDACAAIIFAQVRDNFPAGRKVYIEYGNEHFNPPFAFTTYCPSMGTLGAWSNQTLTADQAYTERAGQLHAIGTTVFNQMDVNGNSNRASEIVRVFGSWHVKPAITVNEVAYANSRGIPIDAVCIAPYFDLFTEDTSPTSASAQQLSITTPTGSSTLPAGTYYIAFTWVDTVSGIESKIGASRTSFTFTSGQLPTVTLPAAPVWGPSGIASINLYLTQAGGASGTETLYASGLAPGTNYTLATSFSSSTSAPTYNFTPSMSSLASSLSTHWPTSYSYLGAIPITHTAYQEAMKHIFLYDNNQTSGFIVNSINHQSALNGYSVGTNPVPVLVGYEGGIEVMCAFPLETAANPLPQGTLLTAAVAADITYDPAMYDSETAYYLLLQRGGLAAFNHFNLGAGSLTNYSATGAGVVTWPYALWVEQPVGKGDGSTASDGVAHTNRFWSDLQFSPHSQCTSVRLKAFQDWVDASSPLVVPGDVYVAPANGATNVSTRVVIVVQFDEPMLPSTLNGTTWTVKLNGQSTSGTIAYNSVTWAATFTPISRLNSLASYVVQLTTGVRNAQGVALPNPITWTFTTGASNLSKPAWFSGLRRPTPRGF